MIKAESPLQVTSLPSLSAKRLYEQLIGLDHIKDRVLKEARLLLQPKLLAEWNTRVHKGTARELIKLCERRTPLIIFGGDVGTGKTALAESFGDRLARQEQISVDMYRLSLLTRGVGAVGQMTALISEAFKEVLSASRSARQAEAVKAVILIIDEADALAQSRELSQMHHEDRAGVNSLLQGLNQIAESGLPVLVIMCTNRLGALDPAVQRRAAAVFTFNRPEEQGRRAVLTGFLKELDFTSEQIETLVQLTGSNHGPAYTYSDLFQRFLPSLVLEAFPDHKITYELAVHLAKEIAATPTFNDQHD